MSHSTATTKTHSDRVKLPFHFDVQRMTKEYEAQQLRDFVYYDVWPLTTPVKKPDVSFVADYADGKWADWRETSALTESPYLSEVVNTFRQHTRVTLVRLLRLAPGAVVKEHTDPTLALEVDRSVIRLTIPILTNEGVGFYLNGKVVPMKPGECWYLRLSDPHRIINAGSTERVNMSIDMEPNKWVRSVILGSYG